MATMLTASCGFTTLQPISSNLHTKLSSWPSSTAPLDLSHPVSAGLGTLSNQKMTMKKKKKKDKDGQIWISNGTRWTASQWLDSRYVHLFFSPYFKPKFCLIMRLIQTSAKNCFKPSFVSSESWYKHQQNALYSISFRFLFPFYENKKCTHFQIHTQATVACI